MAPKCFDEKDTKFMLIKIILPIMDRKEVIIDDETMKIMLLTSEILDLYPKDENRPAPFLIRSKDGKTSMSAS